MKHPLLILLVVASSCAVTKSQVPDTVAAQASTEAQLSRLSQLAGTWEGLALIGGKASRVEVLWTVQEAGSKIEERVFAGTEREIVTVFRREGPFLVLDHRCSSGDERGLFAMYTSPPMGSGDCGAAYGRVEFDSESFLNANESGERHLAAARYEFRDSNHLTATWTAGPAGGPDADAKFELTRKP